MIIGIFFIINIRKSSGTVNSDFLDNDIFENNVNKKNKFSSISLTTWSEKDVILNLIILIQTL